jgi:hypothetical protein
MSQNIVAMGGLHIGIETELLLQAITFEEDRDIPNLKTFAYMVAASYRDNAPNWAAGMHEEVEIDDVDDEEDGSRYTEWVLTDDETIEPATYNPDISSRQCTHLFHCHFCPRPTRSLLNADNDTFRATGTCLACPRIHQRLQLPSPCRTGVRTSQRDHEDQCQRVLWHAYPLIPSEQQWNLDLGSS